MCLTWQWVSILCPTWQGCLFCASYLICATHGSRCLFCASWDTGYLICASHGSGHLFRAIQSRVIHCVPYRAVVSILCLLEHRVSNMCLTWQWVSIMSPTWQGCLFCASGDTGYLICASHGSRCLFCASWDTGYLICASHGSGHLFRAIQSRVIHCVPYRAVVSILCLLEHRVSNMCLTWQWVSIWCPTGQGYLLCVSQDMGVYCEPPGT